MSTMKDDLQGAWPHPISGWVRGGDFVPVSGADTESRLKQGWQPVSHVPPSFTFDPATQPPAAVGEAVAWRRDAAWGWIGRDKIGRTVEVFQYDGSSAWYFANPTDAPNIARITADEAKRDAEAFLLAIYDTPGARVDEETIAVLRRLKDALPTVGVNGWAAGVKALETTIAALNAGEVK